MSTERASSLWALSGWPNLMKSTWIARLWWNMVTRRMFIIISALSQGSSNPHRMKSTSRVALRQFEIRILDSQSLFFFRNNQCFPELDGSWYPSESKRRKSASLFLIDVFLTTDRFDSRYLDSNVHTNVKKTSRLEFHISLHPMTDDL